MNQDRIREAYRRDLTHRITHLRLLASEQAAQRMMLIRLHGIAHPRTIVGARRLNETLGAWRELRRLHQTSASQDKRRLNQNR